MIINTRCDRNRLHSDRDRFARAYTFHSTHDARVTHGRHHYPRVAPCERSASAPLHGAHHVHGPNHGLALLASRVDGFTTTS